MTISQRLCNLYSLFCRLLYLFLISFMFWGYISYAIFCVSLLPLNSSMYTFCFMLDLGPLFINICISEYNLLICIMLFACVCFHWWALSLLNSRHFRDSFIVYPPIPFWFNSALFSLKYLLYFWWLILFLISDFISV